MKVTDLDYALENRLLAKLDIMIKRCVDPKNRKDAVLIVEGSEGEGKTNSAEAIAYYVKYKTKRDIQMFFRLKPLVEFAKTTENKIIIWDEPAIDSLSTDWYKESSKDLIRLLMVCRKKRHFFIFNFVKFHKFSEYVVVDRALGLIHMYSRKGIIPGRFVYIKQKNLERLFVDYRKYKIRSYKKYRSFGGSFPLVENKLQLMGITIENKMNASLEDYEKLKDSAILSIGGNKDKKEIPELRKLKLIRKQLSEIKFPIKNKEDLANHIGITSRTLYNWGKIVENPQKINDVGV